ncbi:hypothetical protein TNCV_1029241 [Trichonephila clavipes]|nr:hypothetical protein TNCV_1029241 [Trichonephila clavipes]
MYSNEELVVMLIMYRAADWNGHATSAVVPETLTEQVYSTWHDLRKCERKAIYRQFLQTQYQFHQIIELCRSQTEDELTRFENRIAPNSRKSSCQVIYSQFGLAIHQNDHQARRKFVEWAQNEIAVVPDFHKRILFSDEAHFWLNGYVNKQNCRIWSEANPQVYVETPLLPEKLTVWCALWMVE